jgi:hypothetical protein
MALVDIQTEIIIDLDRKSVAEFASNPDNVRKWYVNIKSVEWLTPKPLQEGTRLAFKAQFAGRELSYTYEVVEIIPFEKFRMRTAQGPFPMETTYQWEDAGTGKTKMLLRNKGEPKGFSRLLAPFLAGAMRRANRKDLALLKRVLEKDL